MSRGAAVPAEGHGFGAYLQTTPNQPTNRYQELLSKASGSAVMGVEQDRAGAGMARRLRGGLL